MDKIPKLRRKPRPPTIETSVDRTSTDTSESNVSTTAVAIDNQRPSPIIGRQPSTDWFKGKSKTSRKKSPFRDLIRPSAKRARESSPAATTSFGSPQALRVPGQGGAKFPRNQTHRSSRQSPIDPEDGNMSDAAAADPDPGPQMPLFLKLSRQEIDVKYNELSWDERIRGSAAQTGPHPEGSAEWRWGTFKQMDAEEKGTMDRYVNIKPWNHNRVKLRVPKGQLDYVNASTIRLYSPSDRSRPPLRYIAMQGPTNPSIPYVWRMISEQVESPVVIVQLTSNVENGALKCNQYFPNAEEGAIWDLNDEDIWEDGWKATLTLESTETVAKSIEKTRLRLDFQGKSILVWHFLYTQWPDFGVPGGDDLDSFFELMTLSREHSSPAGPRIIHCSAGVGRTGTFISLEHLIRELDVGGLSDPPFGSDKIEPKDAPDPVYSTVDTLRQQRRGMVQGEIQYRFIYQVMRKLWEKRHPEPTEEDDEDMAEGGASIQRPDDVAAKGPESNDPFYDSNNNDDDYDDDDDGGAQVQPEGATDSK